MAFIDKRITLPGSDPEKEEEVNQSKFEKLLGEALLKYTTKLADVINGGIRLNENINGETKTVTTANADTEVSIAHTLKRTPSGFLVVGMNKAGMVYKSGTAFTSTNIYIKCNVATATIDLLIF